MGSPGDHAHEQQADRHPTLQDLLQRLSSGTSQNRIPRRSTSSPCPASFAQSRIWYIYQWQPESPLYNIHHAWHLIGPLDVDCLRRSLNEIIRRHEALRTTFTAPEGLPLQVIAPWLELPLPLVDLSALPAAERQARIQVLARQDAGTPFDLAQGPLLRATLLRLAAQEHVLLLTMHHIIWDSWSTDIFCRELSVLYGAFARGKPSPLPELPVQYADFALWQRQHLQGETLQKHVAFWKAHLTGAPPILDLPADHQRPSEPSHAGARLRRILPADLASDLAAFSRSQHVTPFMTLLTAFFVLLHRYTDQEDLVIGTPIANRTRLETEPLIGFFVNTLALRANFSRNPRFQEFLHQVRDLTLDAYDHQDLSFERLIEELQPERRLDHTPLFQVLFQLDNARGSALQLEGIIVEPLDIDTGIARLDLAVTLVQQPGCLSAIVSYDTDLFERDRIERLLDHYCTLLEAICANPEERIGYLPLLTPVERQRILVDWNDTSRDLRPELYAHEIFSAQATQQPEAMALVCGAQSVTYGELEARTNQLAHYLIGLGLGPESIIAVLLPRSTEWIVAILSALKAGGAYLPLDVRDPPQRMASILRQSEARLILTTTSWLTGLPASHPSVLCLDRDWTVSAGQPYHKPATRLNSHNLAYVIYTSGSTGQPKGVMITHHGWTNLLQWHIASYAFTRQSRVTTCFAPNFDAALAISFASLAAGSTVYLFSDEIISDTHRLARCIADAQITHCNMPPSLLAALPTVNLPHLQTLVIGGEALTGELVERWAVGRLIWNAYGPTEVTVCATKNLCHTGEPIVSIGRPDYSVQVYLLDRYLQPVPVGVPGELCVGGVGLARGYLGDPGRTAERFVPNPFSSEPGARLYRTGDMARFLPDGRIVFLGRQDSQVKIRGYRVELGEIDSALRHHPAVSQALAVIRKVGDTDRLVAYIVPAGPQPPGSFELRAWLQQRLPHYMLPDILVPLASLPLTPAGKLDLGALPLPRDADICAAATFVPPATPTEEAIADIWQEVLTLPQVGRYDNFFDLGGHSLLAMQAIAKLEKRLGLRLSPRDLVLQNLAQLAAACDERLAQGRRT